MDLAAAYFPASFFFANRWENISRSFSFIISAMEKLKKPARGVKELCLIVALYLDLSH